MFTTLNKFFFFVICFSVFISCQKMKYTVYDDKIKKEKIDLSQEKTIFVLSGFVSCEECVLNLAKILPEEIDIIIVSIVNKNKVSMIQTKKSLSDSIERSGVSYYFQFFKRNDPYLYKWNNRLFKRFGMIYSPLIIYNIDNQHYIQEYNEFIKNQILFNPN